MSDVTRRDVAWRVLEKIGSKLFDTAIALGLVGLLGTILFWPMSFSLVGGVTTQTAMTWIAYWHFGLLLTALIGMYLHAIWQESRQELEEGLDE